MILVIVVLMKSQVENSVQPFFGKCQLEKG